MPEEVIKNETTNAVLKSSIDGLAKLTDVQLGHINESIKDLKISMAGFATKAELEEKVKDFNKTVQEIRDDFRKHGGEDVISFGGLQKGIDAQKVAAEEQKNTIEKWKGIYLGVALVVSPLITIAIGWILWYVTTKHGG